MAAVYDFDRVIDRKGTSSLKFDFGRERKGREDLLPLWVADMDFALPNEILSVLKKRIDHGITLQPQWNTVVIMCLSFRMRSTVILRMRDIGSILFSQWMNGLHRLP